MENIAATKKCRKCEAQKPLESFVKDKRNLNGAGSLCLDCERIRNRTRYRVAPEYKAKYREANREKAKADTKAWYAKNRDSARAAMKEYRERNTEAVKATIAEWRRENIGRVLAGNRKRKARELGAAGSHTHEQIEDLLRRQRCRCAICRTSLKSGYHVDHVIPLIRGGSNGIRNIQLLCPTCNTSKGAKDPIVFMREKGRLL